SSASPSRPRRCGKKSRSSFMRIRLDVLAVLLLPTALLAQSPPEMRKILDRLQRLEEQNKTLLSEIHSLREELAAATAHAPESPAADAAHLGERLTVAEQRIQDQDQSKV